MANGHEPIFGWFKQAVWGFLEDDAMTHAAALAFYAALSIAPLLLLLIWVSGLVGTSTQERIISQVEIHAGSQAGQTIETVVKSAEKTPEVATFAGIAAIVATVMAATGVFAQLQFAMNQIWNVPSRGASVKGWLRKRALSLLMIVIIGALLVASMVLSAVLSAARQGISDDGSAYWGSILGMSVSIVVFAGFFAAIFKVLPDAQISWKSTWVGAIITALLFLLGRWIVGMYLAHSSMANAYGASGSLIVLLLWIYYSSLVFLFGAKLTQAWSKQFGRGIRAHGSEALAPA